MRLLVVAVAAVIVALNDAKPGHLNHQRHEFHKFEQSSRIVETNYNGGRSMDMDLTNSRPNYQVTAGWTAWQRNHMDDIRKIAEELRSKYNEKLMLSDYQRQQYVNTGDADCKVLCNQPQVTWTSFSAKSQAEVDELTKSLTHKIFEEIGKGELIQMQISQPNWFEHRAGNELETLFYKKNVSLLGPQSQTNVRASNEDEDLRQTQQAVFDQSQSVENQRQSSVYSQQRERQDRYVSPYPAYGSTYQRQYQISREQQSNRPTFQVGFDQNIASERQTSIYNQQRQSENRYSSPRPVYHQHESQLSMEEKSDRQTQQAVFDQSVSSERQSATYNQQKERENRNRYPANSQTYYDRQLASREKQTRTHESGSNVNQQTVHQNQYHQEEEHRQENEEQVAQSVNQFDQSNFDSEDTQSHVTDVQSNIPIVDGSYFDRRAKTQQEQTRVTSSTSTVDADERERRERTRYQQVYGQSRESTTNQEQSEYSRDRTTTGTQQQLYGWPYRTPTTSTTTSTSTSTTTTTQRPQSIIQSTNKHSIYDHLDNEEEKVINYRPQVIVADINQYQHTTTQQEREDILRRQNHYRGQTRETEHKEVSEEDEDTQQRVQQPDFSDLSVQSQLNTTEQISNSHSTNMDQESVLEREAEDVIRSHDYHQSSGSQRNETAEREAYYAELAKQEKEQSARTRPYIYNVYNKHDGRMRSESERHRVAIQRQQAERQLTETERLTLEREREYERQRLRQQSGYDERTQQTSRRDEQLSQTTYQSRPYAHRGIQTNTDQREEIEDHDRQYNSGANYEVQTTDEDERQQQINVNEHDAQSIHQSSTIHDDELSQSHVTTSVQDREQEIARRRQQDYRAQQTQITQSETSTTSQNENSHVMSLVPKRQQQEQNRKVTEEELLRTINIMKHDDSEYDGQIRQKETYNNREKQIVTNNNKYANTNPQEYNVHYGQTVEDSFDQTNQTVDDRNKTKVYGFHDDQKPKPAEINEKRGDQPPRHTELDYEDSDEVEDEPGIGTYPVAKKPEIGLAPPSVYNQIREKSTTTVRPIPSITVNEDQQQKENIEEDRDLNQQTQQVWPGQAQMSEYERRQYQRTHSYSQTTTGLSRPVQYAATHHELDDNLNQQTMDLTVKPLYPSSAQISTVIYQSSTQRSEAQERDTTQYNNERSQNANQHTSGSDTIYGNERSRYNRTYSQTHSERTNQYHQTNESNEQDDTQQLVDLGQETEDLTQQTQDMRHEDLTQQRQPANEYSSGSNWRRTGFYRRRNETQLQSAAHTLENNQNADDGQRTVMFGQETEDLTQQTQNLRQQADDLSHQQQSTDGQYRRTDTYQHGNEQRQHQVTSQSQVKHENNEDDGQQTVDFGQETEDLRQQHQSFGFDKDDLRQKEERELYYQQQSSGQYTRSQQREMTVGNSEQKDIDEHQATVVEVEATTTIKPSGIRSYLNKAKNWFG